MNRVWMLLLFLLLVGRCVRADDWPQWRGPRRDAVSRETGLLTSWPAGGPKVAYRVSGLGTGYASVVISRGRLFTIGKQGNDVQALALEAVTGRRIWSRKIGATSRHPAATPTVDGDRVYVLDPDGELFCLHVATGEVLWRRSYVRDFGGRMMSGRGYGESPLIDGEKLLCTPGGPDAAMIALDKRTGAVLWKSLLPELGPSGREGSSFPSIVVSEAAGVRQYVQLMGRGLAGFAAKDGRFLWGYNAIANGTANIPTPVVRGDFVFAANGYNAGSVLLRLVPGGETGVTAQVVYALTGSRFQNHHGGVALVGDYIYGGHGSNNGLPTCLELATGRIVWKERGPGVGSASVVCAEGRLYFRYQNGLVALIDASPAGYHLDGTLQVPGSGGDSWAHPVVANGLLYLREQDALWVYEVRRSAASAITAKSPASQGKAQPAEVVAAVRDLGRLGLAVSPLQREGAPDSFEQFAFPNDRSKPVLRVVIPPRSLSPEGTLPALMVERLRKQRSPLFVSLAGTRLSDAGLRQVASISSLVGLNLELCGRLTDAGYRHLQGAKSLRVLILAGTAISAEGIRHLAPLRHLAALDLEVCDGIADPSCEALATMSQLRALNVKKTGFEPERISDAGLRHLGRLGNLEVLSLYGNRVTDAGLPALATLSHLTSLDLSLLAITDAGLGSLKGLLSLRTLNLLFSEGFAGPQISDNGMDALAGHTELRALDLTGSSLTDEGLGRLRSLRNLKRLAVVRTRVTADGQRAFSATMPGCSLTR